MNNFIRIQNLLFNPISFCVAFMVYFFLHESLLKMY
jgi:hypothetical protein